MLKSYRCPEKKVPVKGGATLEVRGDFDLVCIGDSCAAYPCEGRKRYDAENPVC